MPHLLNHKPNPKGQTVGKKTEQEFIESSRQAITAGNTHEEIKSRLEKFAYIEAVRMVGQSLLEAAEQAQDDQHSEKSEARGAYATFISVFG